MMIAEDRGQPLVPTTIRDAIRTDALHVHASRADLGVNRKAGGYKSIRICAQINPPESRMLLQPTLCKVAFGSVQVNDGFVSTQVRTGGNAEKSIPHITWLGFIFWKSDFRISVRNCGQTSVK